MAMDSLRRNQQLTVFVTTETCFPFEVTHRFYHQLLHSSVNLSIGKSVTLLLTLTKRQTVGLF
jgi:hypothetical protein